jgi:hypothetical protein
VGRLTRVRFCTALITHPCYGFIVPKAKESSSKVITELAVDVTVFSYFKGVFARVAQKLDVSPSMVSRVASGHRVSPRIQKALLEELRVVKQKLDGIS